MDTTACVECLHRTWLLGHLAPYIEKHAMGGVRVAELLGWSDENLARAVAPKVADQILARVSAISEERMRCELTDAECWAVCRHDLFYPSGLRELADAPALIGRGEAPLLERLAPQRAVAVVGARRATTYGREVARVLGRDLARAGLTVVSGLAFGIDACAHRGALEGGTTVAVLGCGADVAYPAAHRSLLRRIGESGLVVSELPPGTSPWRWTFPARNRIMAALSDMTVVVEAAEGSGSLITADDAAELGRDLGAVPGPVGSRVSAGPNDLLASGACLVRDAQDVLDAMLGPGAKRLERSGPPLDAAGRAVLEALERGARTCDAIATDLDRPAAAVAAALGELECAGYADRTLVGVYSRTALQPPPAR